MNEHPKNENWDLSPADREQLAQELLELHFGCHEDPARLEARLAAEPALRELQRQVLAQARVLESAVRPEQAPLALRREPDAARRWWSPRSPAGRLLGAAAAAAATVLGFFIAERVACARRDRFHSDHLHLTVSAPKAVPAGAPWSFTVQAKDLHGQPADCKVRWQAFGDGGAVLAAAEAPVRDGQAVVAMAADLKVPQRVEVVAVSATDEVREVFSLSTAAAGPLVHLTTDRPVYRPGETVFVRAVVLDRVTRLPLPQVPPMSVQLLDAKGAPVVQDHDQAVPAGVGSFVLAVPQDSAGGPHQVQLSSHGGAFPNETAEIVVRSFQPPQLKKEIVLDRISYAPGARGAATVNVERLAAGGGGAAGALARAALVIDGTEVWSEQQTLGARGDATFRFVVPTEVAKGAGRFVATIHDGGLVETEVKPFVVPTGKVQVAAFPEGGELIAGVENGLYLECTDPLGRPVDGVGELIDGDGRQVTRFRTAHQGRAKLSFVPREGSAYRVRLAGQHEPFALPAVQKNGIALRLFGDDVVANAPLRLAVAGRGDGPWLLGVFCRGVLVGQTTLRANGSGELRAEASVPLPAFASGVLRATVFDRTLQPIAERLVRRHAGQRLDVALSPLHGKLDPGAQQSLGVRTVDENGRPQRAVVGVSVTDLAAVSLGSEPRVGLVDQAMLFADVERVENLGDFFLGNAESPIHVDLLLGTRGWRRFVWRNDDAAKATILARGDAAAGTLAREGFSHTPQVTSNLAAAQAPGFSLSSAARRAENNLRDAAGIALIALLLLLVAEGCATLLRRVSHAPPVMQVFAGAATAIGVFFGLAFFLNSQFGGRLAPGAELAEAELIDFDGAGAAAPLGQPLPIALGLGAEFLVFNKVAVTDPDGFGEGQPVFFARADGIDQVQRIGRMVEIAPNPDPALRFDEEKQKRAFVGFIEVLQADNKRAYLTQLRARQYAHQHTPHEGRTDFTPTILWNTLIATDERGEATVAFATSDAVTTWLVQADAHVPAGTGRLGQGRATFTTQQPLHVEAKLPVEVSAGDRLLLPIAAAVTDKNTTEVTFTATTANGMQVATGAPASIALQDGRGRVLLPITVGDQPGIAQLTIDAKAGRFSDRITQTIRIAPRGFPHRRSVGGSVEAGKPSSATIVLPADPVAGSGRVTLKVFPSPIAALTEGLQGILQEPHGCFEQASSSNYPNTLVLNLIEANGDNIPAIAARARELLPRGYRKITGYECKQQGYEWFGADPGHEALTAYGLMQFHDMSKVFDVDAAMVERTEQWLLARRDGNGGFGRNPKALDRFGGASEHVTNAYVTYTLLQAGTPAADLAKEIGALVGRSSTKDPYELALISCALHLANRPEAQLTRQRLTELQRADGALPGAKTSITSSGGNDLVVETTGFAILAWLPDAAFTGQVRKALEFVQGSRSASGTFGATQATIVALRALTAYATQNRTMRTPGTLRVFAGDRRIAERTFGADETAALTFELWNELTPGEHALRLEVEGGGSLLPWACDVSYHAELPADDPDTQVAITTTLRETNVTEGATVALDVTVKNRTANGLPKTMAIVGLPAGCELPTRVLEDLQKANTFAFWELQGRELALYWRDLATEAKLELTLDLVARVPGTSSGPASRTYLYYTPAQKRWAAPLALTIAATR